MAVKLHLPPGEVTPVDPGEQHVPVPEESLVGHVVDRHDGAGVGNRGVRAVQQPAVRRYEARLPVVAVENVPRPTKPAGEFHRGSREEDEPLGVIGVVAGSTVERRPVEEVVVGNQVDVGSPSCAAASQDACPPRSGANRHVELDPGRLDRQALTEGLGVGGDHERHIAAQPRQSLWQRPNDIGQTTGLGEGNGLAGDFEHAHSTRSGRVRGMASPPALLL